MNKILIVLLCLSVFLFSCGDNTSEEKQVALNSDKRTVASKDSTIPNTVAKAMIDSLKKKKNKLKINGIVWSRFDSAAMRQIYSDTTVLDVVYFVAVWPDATNKDVPVILVQVKRKNSSSALAPVYEYFVSNSLCPPPDNTPCGTPENPSSN